MNRAAMAQRCLTAVVRTGHYQRSKGLLHDPWSMNLNKHFTSKTYDE